MRNSAVCSGALIHLLFRAGSGIEGRDRSAKPRADVNGFPDGRQAALLLGRDRFDAASLPLDPLLLHGPFPQLDAVVGVARHQIVFRWRIDVFRGRPVLDGEHDPVGGHHVGKGRGKRLGATVFRSRRASEDAGEDRHRPARRRCCRRHAGTDSTRLCPWQRASPSSSSRLAPPP